MICYDSNMCSDGFESLSAALTALADDDPDHRPDTALTDGLLQLRRAIDGLEAQWLRWLAAFDRRGTAASTTATSTTAWVRSTCRLSPTTARDRVALARALPGLPDTAAALAAGDISIPHAQLIALALAELAQAGGAQLAADTEPALVDLARVLDPPRLRRELAHVRDALAPEAGEDAAEHAHQRRGLSASETLHGMVALDGLLDPEGGALLLAALQPLAAPTGPDDKRTPRQRRADALTELARRQLDQGDLPTTGGERPHLTVLVPLDTLHHPSQTPPPAASSDTASPADADSPAPAQPDTPGPAGTSWEAGVEDPISTAAGETDAPKPAGTGWAADLDDPDSAATGETDTP